MKTSKTLSCDQTLVKDLIISLIQQDLRHYQLTAALEQAGLNVDLHDLEIMEAVAQLMGIDRSGISDEWGELYFSYVHRAPAFEVTHRGGALEPLAEECYHVLVACQEIEGRIGK